jgi:hypothetical protein
MGLVNKVVSISCLSGISFIPRLNRVYRFSTAQAPATDPEPNGSDEQLSQHSPTPTVSVFYGYLLSNAYFYLIGDQLMDSSLKHTRLIALAVAVSCGCFAFFVYKLVKLLPAFKHSF